MCVRCERVLLMQPKLRDREVKSVGTIMFSLGEKQIILRD